MAKSYRDLAKLALRMLLPLVTTYECEKVFYVLVDRGIEGGGRRPPLNC